MRSTIFTRFHLAAEILRKRPKTLIEHRNIYLGEKQWNIS